MAAKRNTAQNSIDRNDIVIINSALAQIYAVTEIQSNSAEGQALANSAIREYLAGKCTQKQLVSLLLTKVQISEKRKRVRTFHSH